MASFPGSFSPPDEYVKEVQRIKIDNSIRKSDLIASYLFSPLERKSRPYFLTGFTVRRISLYSDNTEQEFAKQ